MPTNPPGGAFAEWATDGAADKAKPVLTQYATGFKTSDTTDFNSDLNYAINKISIGAKFVTRLSAPEIAVYNMQNVATSPFGATLNAWHIRYDELADKWYATTNDSTTGGDVLCWDSDDGITWSSSKTTSTNANDESCTSVWSDGTVCAVAASNHTGPTAEFWVSTDLTVANMAKASGSFNNIALVTDMLWDQNTSRWFVVGRNSGLTTGYIESSGDDGATWVLEASSSNNLSCIATDQAGNGIALADDSGGKIYATGGLTGTWNVAGTGPLFSREVHYLPHADLFVSVTTSSGSVLFHPGVGEGITGAGHDTDYDFDFCAYGKDFTIFEGDTGTRSVLNDYYALVNAHGHEDFNIEQFGTPAFGTSLDWDADATCGHGQGKMIFLNGATHDLIVSYYGPPNFSD